MHIQAIVAEAAVERLNVRIIGWFTQPREIQRHVLVVSPSVKCFADKIAAVIDLDMLGHQAQLLVQALQHGHDIFAFERLAHRNSQELATKFIDYR